MTEQVPAPIRVWAVEMSIRGRSDPLGYSTVYRSNRVLHVGAVDIVTAINAAIAEVEDGEVAWVVSASHRGPLHKLVDVNDAPAEQPEPVEAQT